MGFTCSAAPKANHMLWFFPFSAGKNQVYQKPAIFSTNYPFAQSAY